MLCSKCSNNTPSNLTFVQQSTSAPNTKECFSSLVLITETNPSQLFTGVAVFEESEFELAAAAALADELAATALEDELVVAALSEELDELDASPAFLFCFLETRRQTYSSNLWPQ